MTEWRELHRPDLHWAPSGLPGWLRLAPGWALRLGLELGRLPLELAALPLDGLWRDEKIPRGTGQPVLVLPGYGFGDPSAIPIHLVLRHFGYRTYRSQIMVNVACPDDIVSDLEKITEGIVESHGGERITVVGQSRGGMLARGLADRRPDLVGRVVSLGGPLNDEWAFYELPRPLVRVIRTGYGLDGERAEMGCYTSACSCSYVTSNSRPVAEDVDVVSVYSKQDGVVDWRSCYVPYADNVEVHCSHMGMAGAPEAMRAMLEAVARPLPEPSESAPSPSVARR